MTALTQFQRLESSGVWRETPDARLRDVVVSVGDATLILYDPLSEQPLSHWSLPAVTRLNPGQRPAIFGPGGPDSDEILEIDDDLMVTAIDKVHGAIEASRPRKGRVRTGLLLSVLAVAALAGAIWLPGAVISHAARVAPPAQREAVGRQVLAQIARSTGAPCARAAGAAVLDRLSQRVIGPQGRLVVLPAMLRGARALPGQQIILGDDLVAGQTTPDVAVGHVLAAQLDAVQQDPMRQALDHAGLGAVIRLLTTGALPGDALDGYGEVLLARAPPHPADELMLAAFEAVAVSSQPYARSLDPTGETVLPLIEGDPFRTRSPGEPILSDGEWVQLQQICDRPAGDGG